MVYCWKLDGIYKADASKCKAEIDSLSDASNENIVKLARNRRTELHKCFEWNVEKAAMRDWLTTAGEIRRSIIIVSVEDVDIFVRAYERDDSGRYRNVSEALNDESFKQTIVEGVKRDIEILENKAMSCQRFFDNPKEFMKAMETAKRSIDGKGKTTKRKTNTRGTK
jgi:hypothetical protein